MTQRLFQDAAGTIPAILAGQPVGLSKRVAGTVDASQNNLDSRPILARWPSVGRRNLLDLNTFDAVEVGRTETYDGDGLKIDLSRDGITGTVIAKGIEGGVPYMDVRYEGTSTVEGYTFFDVAFTSPIAVTPGTQIDVSAYVALLDGEIRTPQDLTLYAVIGPDPAQTISTLVDPTPTMTRQRRTVVVADGKTTFTAAAVGVRAGFDVPIDLTIRVGGYQVEIAPEPTALQIVVGPNDITEPSVKDLWHLYNDGGDSLSVILPAGTYGSAHLAIDRSYNVGTVVSDGVTPLTTMTTDRQIDAIYRLGEFSAGEREALLKYWQEEYPI